MKIGFIGLGIMGRPMALNLRAAGHDVVVPERHSLTQDMRAAAEVVADAAAVAERSDIIILMVPDTPDVEHVLFGAHGVAEGLSQGKLVIDMSSISPISTKDFAARINKLGCDYLDAPVSGGEVGASEINLEARAGFGLKAVDSDTFRARGNSSEAFQKILRRIGVVDPTCHRDRHPPRRNRLPGGVVHHPFADASRC